MRSNVRRGSRRSFAGVAVVSGAVAGALVVAAVVGLNLWKHAVRDEDHRPDPAGDARAAPRPGRVPGRVGQFRGAHRHRGGREVPAVGHRRRADVLRGCRFGRRGHRLRPAHSRSHPGGAGPDLGRRSSCPGRACWRPWSTRSRATWRRASAGCVNRVAGVFNDSPTSEQPLYLAAQSKMQAAAEETELRERAERNTARHAGLAREVAGLPRRDGPLRGPARVGGRRRRLSLAAAAAADDVLA